MTPSNPSSTPLTTFILDALEARGWSQRRLAELAQLSPGALSRMLRGMVTPETETVEKIADALGEPRIELLKLLAAEPANLVAAPESDPDVAYLARRLESLNPTTRRQVIPVVEALLEVVSARRTRGETHAEFIAIYQLFAAHHVTLREAKPEAAQRALMASLQSTLQRFRLLVSDLYALPEMDKGIAPPFLTRHILEQVDTIFLSLGEEGGRQQRWEEMGRSVTNSVGRIVLLHGDLGHHLLGKAGASAAGMARQRPTLHPLVKPLYDTLDEVIAARQRR